MCTTTALEVHIVDTERGRIRVEDALGFVSNPSRTTPSSGRTRSSLTARANGMKDVPCATQRTRTHAMGAQRVTRPHDRGMHGASCLRRRGACGWRLDPHGARQSLLEYRRRTLLDHMLDVLYATGFTPCLVSGSYPGRLCVPDAHRDAVR